MMDRRPEPKRDLLPGVLLILVGVLLLVATQTQIGGQLVLAAVGVCFLIAYVARRRYGVLVAGGILTGLGTGVLLEPSGWHGSAVIIGLGLGFVAIFAIDSLRGLHRAHWWPLIPATAFILIGLDVAIGNPNFLERAASFWPLLVVAVGLLLVLRSSRGSRPPA